MNACSDAKKQYVVLGVLFLLAYIIKDIVWLPFNLLCAPTGYIATPVLYYFQHQ